jgi:NADH-quinone oxidoreductase subunit M
MLGMFSLTAVGLSGSIMQMINHGLSTGALFLLIGMLYERYHTRKITDFSGMAGKMPLFGVFLVFTCLSSVGMPGLNGFIGEVLCLFGIMEHESKYGTGLVLTVLACTGLILGAWYLFTMLRRLLFGPVHEPEHHGAAIEDLKPREWLLLAPIAILCVVIGVYPQPILSASQPDVDRVVEIANRARQRPAVEQARTAPDRGDWAQRR